MATHGLCIWKPRERMCIGVCAVIVFCQLAYIISPPVNVISQIKIFFRNSSSEEGVIPPSTSASTTGKQQEHLPLKKTKPGGSFSKPMKGPPKHISNPLSFHRSSTINKNGGKSLISVGKTIALTNAISKLMTHSIQKTHTKQTQSTVSHVSTQNVQTLSNSLSEPDISILHSSSISKRGNSLKTNFKEKPTTLSKVGNHSLSHVPTRINASRLKSSSNSQRETYTKTMPTVMHILPSDLDHARRSSFLTTLSKLQYSNKSKQETLTQRPALPKPSCKNLIQGNKESFQSSERYSKENPYKKTTNFTMEAKDCQSFIHKRGYIFNTSSEEREFPLAFSIIAFKDVEQVELLLRAIYRPSNLYCVHLDRNAKADVIQEMEAMVKCFPNVFFPSRQIAVKWGTFTVLEVELICMKELLKNSTWKYFINLTGQEFPLKTNLELVRILKILNGANNVDAFNQTIWFKVRWKSAWPPPHDIYPYKGNLHVVLSRGFVDYAINSPIAQNFSEWLKRTLIPDETFFPTLDNNPQLRVPGSNTGKFQNTDYDKKPYIARFKNWGKEGRERSFDWPCAGKRVRGVCVFGVGDLKLLTSRRELFANKFHIDYQPQTLECMYEWHRNRTILEMNGTSSISYVFYKNMPQLKSVYRGNL